jgi:multisubunit Na+/H+ antiporter MnhB subunit
MAEATGRAARITAAAVAVPLAALLAAAVLRLPAEPAALAGEVERELERSGVSHPVTAVLLNFRAYDTWLELGVLLVAAAALLAVRRAHDFRDVPVPRAADPLLSALAGLTVPLMVLAAGYLLWLGSHAPGGAFQSGAVLGAAGVLLLLAGRASVTWPGPLPLRLGLAAGFLAFLAVGGAASLGAGRFLEYPPALASPLILGVETAAALSIGLTLAALFAGARAGRAGEGAVEGEGPG